MRTDGTYLEIDGRAALRFVREYDAPADRVFALISDPAELTHWFPAGVAPAAWTPGAAVGFTFETDGDGGTGTVLAHEPPHRLAFTWDGDELWFALETLADGRTRLTFTTLLDQRDTAAKAAAGWQLCLDAIPGAVEGSPEAPTDGRTPGWEELYQRYVAAGVPSGAHIPG